MKFLFKKSPIKLCCLNCSSLNKIKNKIKLEPIVEFGLEHSEQCCQCQLFGISRRFRLKCGNLQVVFVEIIFAIYINIAHYSCRTSSQTFFFKCNVVSSIAEYCIDYWLLQNQSMCVQNHLVHVEIFVLKINHLCLFATETLENRHVVVKGQLFFKLYTSGGCGRLIHNKLPFFTTRLFGHALC